MLPSIDVVYESGCWSWLSLSNRNVCSSQGDIQSTRHQVSIETLVTSLTAEGEPSPDTRAERRVSDRVGKESWGIYTGRRREWWDKPSRDVDSHWRTYSPGSSHLICSSLVGHPSVDNSSGLASLATYKVDEQAVCVTFVKTFDQ